MFCLLGWDTNTRILYDETDGLWQLADRKTDLPLLGEFTGIVEQQSEGSGG